MRTLVLGSEHAVARALSALPPHLEPDLTLVPGSAVEMLRIRRLARLLRRHRPDYVISLLRPYEQSTERATEERIARLCDEGFRNLAALCTARDAKLIHLSSDQVFAGTREGLFSESDEPAPVTAIGRYERKGELAVLHDAGSRQHIVLRTGWVMADTPGSSLHEILAALAAGCDSLDVALSEAMFPVGPADLARVLGGMIQQLHLGCEASGYFHYSAQEGVTWHDFIAEVVHLRRQVSGLPAPMLKSRPNGEGFAAPAAGAALGCKRLLSTFGVRQRDWKVELEQTLAMKFADRVDNAAAAQAPDPAVGRGA